MVPRVFLDLVGDGRGIDAEHRAQFASGWRAVVVYAEHNGPAAGVRDGNDVFDQLTPMARRSRVERRLELKLGALALGLLDRSQQ